MADTAIRTAERTAQVTRDEVTPEVVGAKQAAPEARLAALEAPQGGCTAGARREAMQRLVRMGLPKPRDEYWRYTDPKLFNADAPAAIPLDEREPQMFSKMDRVKLIFVDGVFDAEASDPLELAGATLETLEQADAQPGHWLAEVYGTLEADGQKPVARPFAALNSATARQGLVIRVTGEAPKPVHIMHLRRDMSADAVLHHVLKLDEGADLTLLETGMSGARTNDVIEVDLAPRARLHHVASVRGNPERVGLRHLFGRVGEEASLKSFVLSLNGTQMRHETVIDFVGDDAVAHVAGAVLGDGETGPVHHDDTVFITHGAERCESRQVYKKVLKNGAVGVFQGKILVKPGAQKTDGYQISQALLLDENSQFLAKPELEIYADDVKCSHGSTTGALDPVALYYLRSRGVPKEQAIVMLVLSFVADALAEVEDDVLRAELSDRLELWMNRHAIAAPKSGGAA